MLESRPFEEGQISGFLHEPRESNGRGLVLTHGAGANCQAPLLVAVGEAFQAAGYFVLRCDLAFRQKKSFGPPHPSQAAKDRDSLRAAVKVLRERVGGQVALGGHSYGGRQASMLAAEDADVASSLLLLSYPLHPPEKPEQMRTAHFAELRTPALFVHGDADPFGTVAEMEAALKQLSGPHRLNIIAKAGHDLKRGKFDLTGEAVMPLEQLG